MKKYGVYECIDETHKTLYVGSSGLPLAKLEYNHRNYWRFDNGYESMFRFNLKEKGTNWKFRWIVEPREVTVKEIEREEGHYIRLKKPFYNVDTDPVRSSIKYGRYE